ncbi:MAG TPA: trypsin-like peptidase domain-containing protein [Allosphingosinicella sp.]
MRELAPGQRVSIDGGVVEMSLEGPRLSALQGELGAMLAGLDSERRSCAAFPALDLATRELRPGIGFGEAGQLRLELAALPQDVDRLLMILFIRRGAGEGLSFRDFGSLAVHLGECRFSLDLTNRGEAALIMAEIYRRAGGWRLAGNGQGFAGGLPALKSALAIDIPIPSAPVRSPGQGRGGHDGGRPPPGSEFSGSGFAVDSSHILTNAHVVEGARKIDAANDRFTAPAEVVLSDPRNDIALLRVDRALAAAARFRSEIDIHLGEDVIVLGFPLQGLLGSGPQATGGNVSALCGIGNDTSVLQFSAPIASGNSGGPILDQSGLVLGQVHSSLNLDRIRDGGSNAENINFGVKGAVVRSFLATIGIEPMLDSGGPSCSRADIVRSARAFIYRIRCEA